MRGRRLSGGAAALAALALGAMALGAGAQAPPGPADCPAGLACVAWDGRVVEIDPALGPVQAIVVEERTTRIVDLDGERTERRVALAAFAEGADGWAFSRLYRVPRAGAFAGADLGDVYALQEQEAGP